MRRSSPPTPWRLGIDRPLLVSAAALVLIAVAAQVSALRAIESSVGVWDHLARLGTAVVVGLVAYRTDHRRLARFSPVFFLAALALSVYANLAAALRAGTRRWLDFGVASLQPGEMAKICLVLLFAYLIVRMSRESLSRRTAVSWLVAAAALVLAVAAQPDLGSAAILVGIGAGMVFLAGLPLSWNRIWPAAVVTVTGMPLLWFFGLRDYQRLRVLAFLNPESDPLGSGYQMLQASIAVGSGGFWGTGWLQGSQTAYRFLPAPHTDFVFAVIAEEFGFVGVSVVLALFWFFGLRLLRIAVQSADNKDPLGALIVGGLFCMLFLQALYNIAMVAGLVPIKGFPLPFMSYGGNSLLITAAAVGLAASVRRRAFLT